MNILLGVVQLMCIGVICFLELSKRSPAVFLWATLLVMFGVPHLLACITGDVLYSDIVLEQASGFVILFCLCYFIVRFLFLKGAVKVRYKHIEINQINAIVFDKHTKWMRYIKNIFCICLMLSLAIYIIQSGGILSSSWGNGREISANESYLNIGQPLSIMFYAFSGSLLIFLLRKDYKLALFLSMLHVLNVLIVRNRVDILPLVVCFIALYLLNREKISVGMICFALFCGVGVIFLVYGLRAYRWYGTLENFFETFSWEVYLGRIEYFLKNDDGELGLRRYMYYFIQKENKFNDFGEMNTYKRLLFVFVPTRWSFGLKPNDFAIAMGSAIGMGEGGSMHPTLFGDCYANAGNFGVFLGGLWAAIISIWDKIMLKFKDTIWMLLAYVLQGVAYVIMARGAVYNGWFFLAYGMTVIVLFAYCSRHVRLRR